MGGDNVGIIVAAMIGFLQVLMIEVLRRTKRDARHAKLAASGAQEAASEVRHEVTHNGGESFRDEIMEAFGKSEDRQNRMLRQMQDSYRTLDKRMTAVERMMIKAKWWRGR